MSLFTKSQPILQEKIKRYFHSKGINENEIWMPDLDFVFPERLKDSDSIHVVFMGSFLEKIFETGNWPAKKYVFWCLCSKVRDILVNVCKFPSHSVGIIPRYALFHAGPEKSIDETRPLNLVYSGRYSSIKNLEFFLSFASAYQNCSALKVEVYLLGNWDPLIIGQKNLHSQFVAYQAKVNNFLNSISFKRDPFWINNLNETEWQSYLNGNCLLVNFSTYLGEDYGVSIAQAQILGCPLLLSDWGAHSDVLGDNVYFADCNEIAQTNLSSNEKILLMGSKLASRFYQNKNLYKKNNYKTHCKNENSIAEPLTIRDLENIRLSLLDEYGFEMSLIGINFKYGHEMSVFGQNFISLFASTEKGADFFNKINSIMARK